MKDYQKLILHVRVPIPAGATSAKIHQLVSEMRQTLLNEFDDTVRFFITPDPTIKRYEFEMVSPGISQNPEETMVTLDDRLVNGEISIGE